MAVQSTYSERHAVAVAGMIGDQRPGSDASFNCETVAGIGFGLAVSQGSSDRGCVLGGTLAGFRGVSMRDVTLIPRTSSDADKYRQNETVAVRQGGAIWVTTSAAVTPASSVYFNATTGQFGPNAGTVAAGVPDGTGNTGGGTCTLTAGNEEGVGCMPGTYRIALREIVSGGGTWDVIRPDGTIDGTAVTGSAYTGQINFTIADGEPDFAAGDQFTVAVTSTAVGPIPGARWLDTQATPGGLSRVFLATPKG